MRFILLVSTCFLFCCQFKSEQPTSNAKNFYAIEKENKILVFQTGHRTPIITQQIQDHHRPYIHPINAPGTEIALTEFSPSHHKHQTGLYWGFTRVNGTGTHPDTLKKYFYRPDKPPHIQKVIGRDFFHNPGKEYWQKQSSSIIIDEGEEVKWRTVYNMLDDAGTPIMQETQTWTFEESAGRYLLSLEWQGEALTDIVVNKFDYGGLFLRMPWKKGIDGEVINAARQRNEKVEGQRVMWVDVGMEIEGIDQWGHMAIFDHPDNDGFPQAWRVDGQFGVGPVSSRLGDWSLKKGESKMIRHQIVAYSGAMSDVTLNELWAEYAGDHGMYNTASLWGIAQEEGRNARFLSADEAVAEMTLKEGYRVNAFASEPMITQPIAFCWDDKGRMWIAENRDYESRGYGFSNSGDSRILILEDTDKDGVADKQTVFLEGIPFPSAIAVGFDGLYLGAPPHFLFVPDKDKNDKADLEDIQILLTGWGIRDRHETINSLHWGPDGWLYGLEGFATPSKIRKPSGDDRIYRAGDAFPEDLLDADGVDINGGVWRYHPVKDKFEVVAHGFSNPWGIDHDANGQLFISACVIPHLFHIIPGGIYHRQGGKHFNSYVYKDIQTIVDHRHRSAHGGARIYQSDAFPIEQQGRLFMANIHEHAVLSDVLTSNGSGFTASHGEDFLLANNAQWIGFSMEIGPEGGLYILDWHDADICGKEVLHKETGRVYRIMPSSSHAEHWQGRFDDLSKLDDDALVALQKSESDWHSRRARIILQHRASERTISATAVDALNELLKQDQEPNYRMKAFWTLHITNNLTVDQLHELLNHPAPYMRAWAVQFLCEDKSPLNKSLELIRRLAEDDTSPIVRLYLAAALQRIDPDAQWNIAESLVLFQEDADDPNIPLMIWFGIEHLIAKDINRAIKLASNSRIPMITNHIARRIVDADQFAALMPALESKSPARRALLQGLLAGLEGRNNIQAPENWTKIYDSLLKERDLMTIARQINQQFDNVTAARELIATLTDNGISPEERKVSITRIAALQRDELVPLIPELIKQQELRISTIRAIAAFDEPSLGQLLLDEYPSSTPLEKQEIIQTLSSRPIYGWQLTEKLKEGQIPKKEIPAYIAMQLRRVVGNGFVEIWGPIDELSSDYKGQYAKYQRLLSDEAISNANPVAGRIIFKRACGICHKMYDEGAIIGPDLTGSNRGNTAYLLSNIIEPSNEIQDDYKMVVLTTRDGRTYAGNIIAENDRQITLRIVGQDQLVINKSDIQSKEVTEKSMMPEGILQTMTNKEVLDLMAYMRTLNQVTIPESL